MTSANRFFLATVVILGMAVLGCAPASPANQAQLPAAATQTLQKAYPGCTIEKVKVEDEDGVKVYEANLRSGKMKKEVTLTAAGEILEIETPMATCDLPKAVADAVAKAAPGAKITEAASEEVLADAKLGKLAAPKVTYKVEVQKGGKEGEMTLSPEGKVLKELKWEEQEEKEGKGNKEHKDAKEGKGQKGHEDADGEDEKGEHADKHVKAGQADWRDSFSVNKADLANVGENPYFILTPGYRLTYKGGKDTLTITVLNDTKVVDGVKTRIVEERETKGGQLAEISRNYFAIDPKTKDLYYFGEDVDEYKDGKVVAHTGSWQSGVDGAKFGLMIPGSPKVGDKFYNELAPKVAMDRSEIVSVTGTMKTPAGEFKNVLTISETSALESGSAKKCYAPGVGLLNDAEFELVKIERGK